MDILCAQAQNADWGYWDSDAVAAEAKKHDLVRLDGAAHCVGGGCACEDATCFLSLRGYSGSTRKLIRGAIHMNRSEDFFFSAAGTSALATVAGL